jgi:uncharacterized membrane protein
MASLFWMVALSAATAIAAAPHPRVPAYVFATAVYFAGSFICHQRPERSFHFWTAQFPVCARCAGIYAGATIAALAFFVVRAGQRVSPLVRGASARAWFIAALVPSAATLVYEWTTGVTPANWIRALAGVLLGAACTWIVMEAMRGKRREVN